MSRRRARPALSIALPGLLLLAAMAGFGIYVAARPAPAMDSTVRALPAGFTPPPPPSPAAPFHPSWTTPASETTCTQWIKQMEPWQQNQLARELLDYERTHPDAANPQTVRAAAGASDEQVAFVVGEIERYCAPIAAKASGGRGFDWYVRQQVFSIYVRNWERLKP